MIESIAMAGSLIALGYAFFLCARLLWSTRSDKGTWKWIYGIVSFFILANYILFSFVLFSFIIAMFSSPEILNVLNVVMGIFFLSGAGLIGAVIKYHINTLAREAEKKIEDFSSAKTEARKASGKKSRASKSPKHESLLKEIDSLKKELDSARQLNKLAADREMRIIGLKKKIEELEKK